MKKILLALVLGPLLPVFAQAAATATPTFTPTVTQTVTPTYTNTPIAQINVSMTRRYVMPNQVWANDGVTAPVTTPVPGGANPWLEQSVSRTAFVLSTGSAKARFSFIIPNDFEKGVNAPNMNVYAYASMTSTPATITMTLNVARNPYNDLLPSGGVVYPGTATEMSTALQAAGSKVVRVPLPLSSSARFQGGDLLSFDLQRSSGALNLYIYGIEIEYDPLVLRKP